MKLRTVGLLVLVASAFMITACGQKGPLYIHKEEAPAEQAAPAADPAEAAEKEETGNTGK